MKQLWAWIRFFRLINLMMIAFLFWVLEYVVLQPLLASQGIGLSISYANFDWLVLDVLIVAATGYIINDWYDIEIDRINRPTRLLVAYPLSRKYFYALYFTLLALGLFITLYLAVSEQKLWHALLYPVFVFALWYYAAKTKSHGLKGNLKVAMAIVCLPWLVVLAESSSVALLNAMSAELFQQLMLHLICFSMLLGIANALREIVKDAEDAQGDQAGNVQSFYLKRGPKSTRILSFALVLTLLVLKNLFLMFLSFFFLFPLSLGSQFSIL